MEPIADLDALRSVLRQLTERRLVVYLTPEGRRGTVVTHGFHEPDELERLRAKDGAAIESEAGEAPSSPESTRGTAASNLEAGLNDVNTQISDLRSAFSELEVKIANLAEEVRAIKEGLGM